MNEKNKREEGNPSGRTINWNIFNMKIYRNIYVKIIKLHTKNVCVIAQQTGSDAKQCEQQMERNKLLIIILSRVYIRMHKFIESGNPFLTTVYHFSVNDSIKNISALSINRTLIDEIFYSEELCNLNSFLFKRRDVCTVPNESIRKTFENRNIFFKLN